MAAKSKDRNDDILFRLAKVESVTDDNYGLRIKVRLVPEDNDVKNGDTENLPFCFPLMPKLIHVNPKIGECVLVCFGALGESMGDRYFIGPIISQPQKLKKDYYEISARSLLNNAGSMSPMENPLMKTENTGTMPDREDVALQGRDNSDVILPPNEVLVRCGFNDGDMVFNKTNHGYLQMKYYKEGIEIPKKSTDESNSKSITPHSFINIVGDRINLLSRDNKDTTSYNLYGKNGGEYLTSLDQKLIEEQCHQIPYGDKLAKILRNIITVINTHYHDISIGIPKLTTEQQKLLQFNDSELLSNAVRIN